VKRVLVRGTVVALVVFLLIQFVPYGRSHSNPPITDEPEWDSPRTRALAVGACFSCHSNETKWPWYSNVAPISWLLQRDVDTGRAELNFSEWNREQDEAKDAAESVAEGEMPPLRYALVNSRARLTDAERRDLLRGLRATLDSTGDGDNSGPGGSDGD
jgi:mono/diheme cytochrome c family protein